MAGSGTTKVFVSLVEDLEIRIKWPEKKKSWSMALPPPKVAVKTTNLSVLHRTPQTEADRLQRQMDALREKMETERQVKELQKAAKQEIKAAKEEMAVTGRVVQTTNASAGTKKEPALLKYEIVGSRAAKALLNRLAQPGADRLGALAPIAAVTLPDAARDAAGIPKDAKYFAFAYPLPSIATDSIEKLLAQVVGSASRLDDEFFFFMLLGGFCYFDAQYEFLQANCISLKETSRSLLMDGPYAVAPEAAEAMSNRLKPVTLTPLRDALSGGAQIVDFAWVNPGERPGGEDIAETLELDFEEIAQEHGAFLYQRRDGRSIYFRIVEKDGQADPTQLADGAEEIGRGFERMFAAFDEARADSQQLLADIDRDQEPPLTKWVKFYGLLIPAYYVLGCVAYSMLEGFSSFDTVYFLTTTVTTVGYGDLTPSSPDGRLLTVLMAPVGVTLVMGGFLPCIEVILQMIDSWTASLIALVTCASRQKGKGPPRVFFAGDTSNQFWRSGTTDSEQRFEIKGLGDQTHSLGPTGAYVHAFLSPLVLMLVGFVAAHYLKGFSPIDAAYWVVITTLTVGYGDLVPHSLLDKIFTMVFMLLGTSALAATLIRVEKISTARKIYRTSYRLKLADMLKADALRNDGIVNYQPTLSQDEFVLRVLKDFDLVDDSLVNEIRNRFTDIVQASNDPQSGTINLGMTFRELVVQGRVVDTNRLLAKKTTSKASASRRRRESFFVPGSAGAQQAAVPSVDMCSRDHGFQEWYESVWQPEIDVLAGKSEAKSGAYGRLRQFGVEYSA